MSQVDIIYLAVIFSVYLLINFAYKKFPKNHEKLYEMLTKESLK